MTQKTKTAASRARKYSLDLSRYYRKPATQVSLSIVLSIFIVAFFILVALRPTFVTIASLNNEIEQAESTLSKMRAKVAALEKAAQVWETIQTRIPDVDEAIPQDGPEYAEFARAVEILASEAGVTINGYSIGEALLMSRIVDVYSGKNQDIIEMNVALRVAGEFPQILSFVTKLMELDRLVAFEALTIARETTLTSGGSQVGVSISGTVQYMADPNQMAKILAKEEK